MEKTTHEQNKLLNTYAKKCIGLFITADVMLQTKRVDGVIILNRGDG